MTKKREKNEGLLPMVAEIMEEIEGFLVEVNGYSEALFNKPFRLK